MFEFASSFFMSEEYDDCTGFVSDLRACFFILIAIAISFGH
jgi:hypothetical protein